MGEEVRITDYGGSGGRYGDGEDSERVLEWEAGLPNVDDLTPLSQSLISSDLLAAFNITPEPYRSMIDVNRASQSTLSDLRGELEKHSLSRFDNSKSFSYDKGDEMVVEGEETADLIHGGSGCRKLQRIDSGGDDGGDDGGDVDGGGAIDLTESGFQAGDSSTRVLKRPRLVWTPQLHKRFIEVVAHLGVKNAVPKTIMQLMNVEGLSRENVASHLQKYRLYLKRMQLSKSPSSSDHLFASTPVPENLHESAAGNGGGGGGNGYHTPAEIPMPYRPQMVHHMPYPSHRMVPNSGFNSNSYPYNNAVQQRNWSEYHHGLTPNNK